jgi:hypothetical protein
MPSEAASTTSIPPPATAPASAPERARAEAALAALAAPRDAFRSALAATAEEIRGLLAAAIAPGERPLRLAAELGPFAAARIDAGRLAELLSPSGLADGSARAQVTRQADRAPVERALARLVELELRGDDLFRCRVAPGGDLQATVEEALAEAGCAFGAARLVELAHSGRYRSEEHSGLAERFAFRRWSRAERAIAPPLVVEVEGADLAAGGLARFLDGAVKLVLVVAGEEAPPAALVRLITPGVLVLQATGPGALAEVASCPGPAVAALLPTSAARFIHAPALDGAPARLTIEHLPAAPAAGAVVPFPWGDELRQLAALAAVGSAARGASAAGVSPEAASASPAAVGAPGAVPVVIPPGAAAAEPDAAADQADRLAAWLLQQAGLAGAGAAG